MKYQVSHFVSGVLCDAVDGRRAPLIDPTTGEEYRTAPVSGERRCGSRLPGSGAGVRDLAGQHSCRPAARPAAHRGRDYGLEDCTRIKLVMHAF
jgi:hypothetical protein